MHFNAIQSFWLGLIFSKICFSVILAKKTVDCFKMKHDSSIRLKN